MINRSIGRAVCLALTLALFIGQANAAVYYLVTNAATTLATPPNAIYIEFNASSNPASIVTPQVVVSGGGACTAQIVGSNDAINWISVGSAIAVTTGNITGGLASGAGLTATWQYWGATITTLTGTGSKCSVLLAG